MVLVFTVTILVGCSSKKITTTTNAPESSSAITSPQPSPTAKPSTSAQATPSPTAKPSTSAQATPSPAVKASSKITSGVQAAELVKKSIFNNNEGVAMAYNDVETYNGFQCYPVKASAKEYQANGGTGTIGLYDVEIESGRIWDLSTNKIAVAN